MKAARAEAARIHLVPHTHWDREWYRPFQSFRMQLVEVIDRVLEMLEAEPDFVFTLDGQLATIDDYLAIRPEHEERIRRHVQSGRLAVGPWQILMDEFLVSGETLVRNSSRAGSVGKRSADRCWWATCRTCSATLPRCRRFSVGRAWPMPSSGEACRPQ